MERKVEGCITVDNLVVQRGSCLAIRHLSASFPSAAWTGVVGANGSGKTTLLKAISGRIPISGGDIRVRGEEIKNRVDLARRIGLAPEIGAIPPRLTGGEVLALMAEQSPADMSDLKRLRKALQIDNIVNFQIRNMSSGMKQRISLFGAFVSKSSAVVLDEPLNWLDPVGAHDLKQELRRLVTESGFSIITAMHDTTTLALYCDRGILLADGSNRRTFDADELRHGGADIGAFEQELIEELRSLE